MGSNPDIAAARPPVHRRRSLRQRALWSIGIAISLLAAGLYGVSRWVILNGFEKLEREETRQSLLRVTDTVQEDLAALSRTASEYSSWDQMYSFAHTGDPQFVKSELPDSSFTGLKINFILILDAHGRVIARKGYDQNRSAEAPVPPDLLKQLSPNAALLHFVDLEDKKAGILVLSQGPALVVSQPILTSDNLGPIAGTFIMGRWVDEQELTRLSGITHVDLTMSVLKDRAASVSTIRRLSESPEQWIHVLDDHTIAGDQVIDDINGKPAILVTVNIPRTIYQQGRLSLVQFIILLLAASALFTAVMLGVLERLVLNRLAKLSGDVADIGAGADFAARVEVEGADELSKLGGSINRMLDALERSQQARAEQSARLRMMIERMPAVLWTTDLDLRFVSAMGAGLQALDLKPNEIAGVSIFDYFGTRDTSFEPLAAHFRALNGHALSYETKWHERLLQCHVEPLRDVNDAIVGVIGIALDDTEHALVQEALRESEISYQSLIEEAPYGICRCGVGGSFTLVNHALVRMLGFATDQELLVQNIGVDVFDNLSDHASFVSLLQEHGSADGVEAQWKRSDGKTITVHLAGRAVRDAAGQIAYFEIIAEDVSERKQLELQLRQSQKMQAIGQLAGGVAHDFNNLLMVVKGHLELVLAGMTPSDPLYPRLDQIQKAAQRASSLTRQLLAFSRLQVLQPQILDLNSIVSGMIQMLSRLIGENIDLVFRPGGILGRVKADAGQMEQVLLNLVVNARDAMPSGGILTIETSNVELDQSYAQLHSIVKPGPYVMLAVSDTGVGIDQATQARIFEPFFTTKEPGKGTGLGLSTVYGVIKQSDGYIWVYSEPGQGTTFKIYLPLATDAVESSKSTSSTPASVVGSETILLVEDEESVRSLVRDFLLANGHTVLEAGDGPDAIRIAETHKGQIDLLISDVIMPQTSGRELSEEIKKRLPNLKVLFISGYTDDSVVRHGIIEGEVAFLQKPFTMKALAAKVREILDDESIREYSSPPQS